MFLCREVKLPIHCFKEVEMLQRENSGSKLGKWRADKRKSLLGRDTMEDTIASVALKFLLHTWPLLYCFRSSNGRKCILQRLNSLSLFPFNSCIVNILFPGTCITMYFFRHSTALSWAIWKEPRQLDLFKNWMAYTVCSFQANSVQNLSFEHRIWLYWPCVYFFLSIVCTCRTLGAIKEKKMIVSYFSFFTVILFFFYQRLTSSHSLPQDKTLQIYTYETDQFIINGWVQTTCLVQRILVLNIFASLTYAYYYLMNLRKKISEYWRSTKISFISENLSPIYQMVSEKFSLKNRKFCTENV